MNHELGDEWQAFSEGTKPADCVHPMAIKTLDEIGIKHEGYSKSVEVFKEKPFNLVVTVCDSAAEECPVWLRKGKRIHNSYPDPAVATGTDEEIMQVFRNVRDDIMRDIPELLHAKS